jgi:diaminopimelate epimerase
MTPLQGNVVSLVFVGIVLLYVNYNRQPQKSMNVAYTKMHGTGNLILVVDQRRGDAPLPSPERLRELADESTGPGFDQLMWITAADEAGCAAAYRVFNADGSEVSQCGNGARCVAAILAGEDGHAQSFTLSSPAGPIAASVGNDGLVAVSMGTPAFEPDRVPFLADDVRERYRLEVAGVPYDVAVVSMGNPHCVLQVDDVTTAPVERLGALIEKHPRFPEKANVGFVCITGRDSIDLRVFERGVGETAACGTGACAAVVTGQRLGLLGQEVGVRLPGGQVVVSWRGGSEPVWLSGNAEYMSEGFIEL